MAREIDDAWVEEAITAYRRMEQAETSFTHAVAQLEVTVRSPDGLIEAAAGADGRVRRVTVTGSLEGRSAADVSRAIEQVMAAAQEAAEWARHKLRQEKLGQYGPLESGLA